MFFASYLLPLSVLVQLRSNVLVQLRPNLPGLISNIPQGLHDLVLVLRAEGLQRDAKLHCRIAVGAYKLVVLQLDDIALGVRHG